MRAESVFTKELRNVLRRDEDFLPNPVLLLLLFVCNLEGAGRRCVSKSGIHRYGFFSLRCALRCSRNPRKGTILHPES
jgi:hypothetical protein